MFRHSSGGFDLGAAWCGIATAWQIEKDKYCRAVLKKHFPYTERYEEIRFTKGLQTVDIISGGLPCQPTSVAGKQLGKKDLRWLWPEAVRIIGESKPAWIVLENPSGIINFLEFEHVLVALEAQGFQIQQIVLPACSVSAPHIRRRIFIIGHNPSNTKCIRAQVQIEGKHTSQSLSRSNGQTWNSSNTKINRLEEQTIRLAETARLASDYWNQIESPVCSMDDGISNRLHKLRALGNAVVPQVAFRIFSAIKETIEGETNQWQNKDVLKEQNNQKSKN